jgi:hypothetical protein
MSTTDHPPSAVPEHGPIRTTPDSEVVQLDALRDRKRLDALKATRRHLATTAGQQRSHGLEEAEETFGLQLGIESTIRNEFLDEYEALLSAWFEADAASEHAPDVLTAECAICRSIAAATGVNLLPPDAA